MTEHKRIGAVALGILAIGLGLRLHGLRWGLPAVYEEAYPFKKSWEMWGWGAGPLDLNPHFFNYPTFAFYLQFLGQGLLFLLLKLRGVVDSTLDYRVFYVLDKTPFYLMGRGITALFGAATVLATLAIGRRVGGLAVAAVAATIVAVNHSHIAKSQVIEVDVPLTFLATLCCFFSLRILGAPRRRDYLLAGLCGGLATSTKYNGALLALPILLAHLLATADRPPGGPPPGPARRRARAGTGRSRAAPRHGGWGNLGLAALVFVTSFFLTSPYVLLDQRGFWTGFRYESQHMRDAHFGLADGPAVLYYLRVMTDSLFGWPLALLAGAALVFYVAVRRRGWALVLAVFPVVYVALISSWQVTAERYILPLLPLAAVFGAVPVVEASDRLRRVRAWLPAAAVAILLAIIVAPSLVAYRRELGRLRGDTRTLARAWIEARVPPGSFLLLEPYGPEPLGATYLQNLESDVRDRILKERPDARIYAVMFMPMYQVRSENTAIFYDPRLYADVADLVVTSSAVSSRYRANPTLFRAQNAFYDTLETRWTRLREFGPADGGGPRLTVYGNPRQKVPFQRRGVVAIPPAPPVVADRLPGAFARFFARFASVYESYGYHEAAAALFQMGLRHRDQPQDARQGLGLGAVRSLLAAGRPRQALAMLDELERDAGGADELAYWRGLQAQVAAAAHGDSLDAGDPEAGASERP